MLTVFYSGTQTETGKQLGCYLLNIKFLEDITINSDGSNGKTNGRNNVIVTSS
ncbi:UNVERIFIED_CONTAM: hypothetical protein FKN15_047681 [Acipenser sinensis]